jgi:hypothetical protein
VGDLVGSLDIAQIAAGTIRMAGWAIDTKTWEPVEVHLYVDQGSRGTTGLPWPAAIEARPDLARSCAGTAPPVCDEGPYASYGPHHGFDVVVDYTPPPVPLVLGSYTPPPPPHVCAHAIERVGGVPTGYSRLLGCKAAGGLPAQS